MEDHRECLVCSALINSTHLGMDVCRPCASFYKRAKLTGAVYPCRQGTFQCPVVKESKFMCRRCRFVKCVAVGLAYDGPMRIRAKASIPLLQRIEKEFKAMIERRRIKEFEFLRTCKNCVIVPHPREKIYHVRADASFEMFTIALTESWVFFNTCFPALAKLSPQENERIFKEYMMKLGIVFSYYLTKKVLGDVGTKVMSSVLTCYDSEMPIDFYYPEHRGDRDSFQSSVNSHNEERAALFVPQFNKSQLTDKEFYALAAIVLTEYEVIISEEAQQNIDDIRYEIYQNLHAYYRKEMGLTDYSVRLGNLMSLHHTIQECFSLYNVVIRYYSTFFDTYLTEQFMKTFGL